MISGSAPSYPLSEASSFLLLPDFLPLFFASLSLSKLLSVELKFGDVLFNDPAPVLSLRYIECFYVVIALRLS